MEKCGRARQSTDDNIIRRMRFTCWVTKATDTHSVYVILIALPRQQNYMNAPQCYVTRTLPVLLLLLLSGTAATDRPIVRTAVDRLMNIGYS